jgi:hypothetical protein
VFGDYASQRNAPCGAEEVQAGLTLQADAAARTFRRSGFHHQREHKLRARTHRERGAVAGGFEEGEGFVTEVGVLTGIPGGKDGEGFQSHGANGNAVFVEAGANDGQEAPALVGSAGIVGGGDEDVAAGLPLVHWKRRGNLREEIGVIGEDAWVAAADEAGQLSGAAVIAGRVRAEGADELAGSGAEGFREECLSGGCGVGGFP